MTVAAALQHSPRRILFFVGSMNAGGAERVAATLVNAWAARGDEACLVMTHLASRESFYSLHSQVQCVSLADYLPARGRWLNRWPRHGLFGRSTMNFSLMWSCLF